VVCFVEGGAKLGEVRVPHQHQEAQLGQIAGRRRVEAGRAVLDRIHPVEPYSLADRQLGPGERLRRQPLHRVAMNGSDFCSLAGHPDLITGPAATLKALTKIEVFPLFRRRCASYMLGQRMLQ
jgi:hypothetical protein